MANKKGSPQNLIPFGDGSGPYPESVHIRVKKGKKGKLKSIPDWTNKLREAIDKLIEEHGTDE